jgi:SAM-dependent methyltransferase
MTRPFVFSLLYRLGIAPWDRDHVPTELAELVNAPAVSPPGRALDLGCGTGTQAVYLAERGWQVTGVDFTARALDRAQERARAAGVTVNWVRGDVSALTALGLDAGFDLVYDIGCFHTLPDVARDGYASGVNALATPGATFLLMGFRPGHRGPAPRGVDAHELTTRLGNAWKLEDVRRDTGPPLPRPLRNVAPTWYRLTKKT